MQKLLSYKGHEFPNFGKGFLAHPTGNHAVRFERVAIYQQLMFIHNSPSKTHEPIDMNFTILVAVSLLILTMHLVAC